MARCLLQSCADLSRPVALVHVGLAKAHDRVNSKFLFILLDHGSVGQVVTEMSNYAIVPPLLVLSSMAPLLSLIVP